MGKLFVKIFDFFQRYKWGMYLSLFISLALMIVLASRVSYQEDITSFFPKQKQDVAAVFKQIGQSDNLFVMISTQEEGDQVDHLIALADTLKARLDNSSDFSTNAAIEIGVNAAMIDSTTAFIYNYLPLFLTAEDYDVLSNQMTESALQEKVSNNYQQLISPMGGYISDFILKDPFNLGTPVLKRLELLGSNVNYTIIDNYIFSSDEHTLFCTIKPNKSFKQSQLIKAVEAEIEYVNNLNAKDDISYFGATAVAEYNARQIKWDTMVTLNIAILLVVFGITFAFRSRYSVFLLLMPALYGVIFSLALIYLIKGEISLIAVGSGSIIFGIALSYVIHFLSHTNHSDDIREIIDELAYPLTVGSFTTIGAFIGLVFTDSNLLNDFGLFAAFTLVGATIFTLIYLPHFIRFKAISPKGLRLLRLLENVANYPYYKKKYLVVALLAIFVVGVIYSPKVTFDSNMLNLNYMPEHLAQGESRLNEFFQNDSSHTKAMFVSYGKDNHEALEAHLALKVRLDSILQSQGIESFVSINDFILSEEVQQERLNLWQSFWTPDRVAFVENTMRKHSAQLGFEEGAYDPFFDSLKREYGQLSYAKGSNIMKIFPEWIVAEDAMTSITTHVNLKNSSKEKIYEQFLDTEGVIVADRGYLTNIMVSSVKDNFYLVLYVSSILIFMVLLLSYGRIELTLMTFAPMFVSWIIILGFMALFGIPFNIVTIILSTFIFGIGDDFSIFVMDGLQSEYASGSKVLHHHKTAILFSAFSLFVGMGVLIFAQHPALKSLGLISLLGMVVVVVVSFLIQPLLFNFLVTMQVKKGGQPFTLFSLLHTVYAFVLFVTGCLLIQLFILLSFLIPLGQRRRKTIVGYLVQGFCRFILIAVSGIKRVNINEHNETFEKPSVIIANHQSFIDILTVLTLHNKVVMVTNGWVWNSPFFGRIVRFLDFYHNASGYEDLAETLKPKIEQGYSVVIFPEGTRSEDFSIKRFHKGAFYLAELLKIDIIPVILYGPGMISSKKQPFYIKSGILAVEVNERIKPESELYGKTYQERSKVLCQYFKDHLEALNSIYNRPTNPYYRDAVMRNYILKGPVLEWYMRVKFHLEDWYTQYEKLLPRKGFIVDLGCGYGAMSYMLSATSADRKVLGVDYDAEKIRLAQHSYSKNSSIEFMSADIRTFEIPNADAFIISDVLHYIDYEHQRNIINTCISNLSKGGVFIIRDGDSSQTDRHKNTETTEKWSTEIVKFNKTDGPLCFLSSEMIHEIAKQREMSVEVLQSDSTTSNTLFILRHK